MMPTATEVLGQINKITEVLIGISLCNDQNFPAQRKTAGNHTCIYSSGQNRVSSPLRNVPYRQVYEALLTDRAFNLKMLDGALIHLEYNFGHDGLQQHRLAYFPSPTLEEYQNSPEIYDLDEVYADVVAKNIVPLPIRFDFDVREKSFVELEHPRSHLTLGQYQNCRIPVSAPLMPAQFVYFILRNFYNTAFKKYSSRFSAQSSVFEDSITEAEKKVLHVRLTA